MTKGQRLYEYKHPPFLTLYDARAPWGQPVSVENEHVPWRLLTEACRASWETTAQGHFIFSGEV